MGSTTTATRANFLTQSNLFGAALVIVTGGIDLSIEAMIGLVAYSIARSLELQLVDPLGALDILAQLVCKIFRCLWILGVHQQVLAVTTPFVKRFLGAPGKQHDKQNGDGFFHWFHKDSL